MTWVVYRLDADRRRVAEIEPRSLTLTVRWNAGDRWVLAGHADDVGALRRGDRVLFARDGETVVSGPAVRVRRRVADGDDVVEVEGIGDDEALNRRLTYPTPAEPPDGVQGTRDQRTGDVGALVAAYVDANAGPGARPERVVPGLVAPPPAEPIGETVVGRARWRPLGDFLDSIAERGKAGWRCRQALGGTEIVAEAVAPVDRPGARIDVDGLRGSGALAGWNSTATFPDVTVAVAGGRGEGADRLIVVDDDPVAVDVWGRVEAFLNRNNAGDEDDLPSQLEDLGDALDEALDDGAADVALALDPVDAPAFAWRSTYDVGDRVRVYLDDAWRWVRVRGVDVAWDADGERVAPYLADTPRRDAIRLLARLGALEDRVAESGRR